MADSKQAAGGRRQAAGGRSRRQARRPHFPFVISHFSSGNWTEEGQLWETVDDKRDVIFHWGILSEMKNGK
jgi:hypothetical protein